MLFNLILRSLAFQRCMIVHIKYLPKNNFFCFFPKKVPKIGKILVSFEDKSTNVISSIFSQ